MLYYVFGFITIIYFDTDAIGIGIAVAFIIFFRVVI